MEELNNVLVGELATIPFEKIDYIVLEHEYEFFKFTYVVVGKMFADWYNKSNKGKEEC